MVKILQQWFGEGSKAGGGREMSKLTQSRQRGDSQIHLGRFLLMIMVMPSAF